MYLIVEGECEFLSGDGWGTLSVGEASIQEPETVHALNTVKDPLVVFWAWTGNISSPIWAFDENGERFYPEMREL